MKKLILLASLMFVSIVGYSETNAFVAKTGQLSSYITGDDGYYRLGAEFTNSVRFAPVDVSPTAVYSNCILDKLTGLVWLKNPDSTLRNWTNAIYYCENLDGTNGRGGYTDWRLPNRRELFSLVDDGTDNPCIVTNSPFINIQSFRYWSSTTCNSSSEDAWAIIFINGYMFNNAKTFTYYTWPVGGP